jgi:hypothetical protein
MNPRFKNTTRVALPALLALGSLLTPAAALCADPVLPSLAGSIVPVLPDATYLHISTADTQPPPLFPALGPAQDTQPIDLWALGYRPGDTIQLTRQGEFRFSVHSLGFSTLMIGVFSASPTLLGPSVLNRVADAIEAGDDFTSMPTFDSGNLDPTDIAEDFRIFGGTGTLVTIPEGARYLFVSASDSKYNDNLDVDGDFAVTIGLHRLSYSRLCLLTHRLVTKAGIAHALCVKLQNAEAAAVRGNTNARDGLIGAYINQLRAQTGKSVTAENADALVALAERL